VPYVDVLRGLKALFLEGPESPDRAALLRARAPGLAPDERRTLEALEADRVGIYVGLLRDNQAAMLDFVAPMTVELAERFAGTPRAEFARATLVETPRRSSRLRELAQRVIDHLEGAGAAVTRRCPAILDMARLERAQTEAFYAPDVEGALTPPEFAALVTDSTVEEVLALAHVVAPSVRIVSVGVDVLGWRDRRAESGRFDDPPPALASPLEVLVVRDPESLQPVAHRLEPALLELVRPRGDADSLESLAARWLDATGLSTDDPSAPGRFFEQAAEWVRQGVILVLAPGASAAATDAPPSGSAPAS